MTRPSHFSEGLRTRCSALSPLIVLSLFGAVQCVGTEADNPFAEPVDITSCKAKDGYVGFAAKVASPGALGRTRFANLSQALTSPSEIPVWLECVDWSLEADGKLALQVLNFRGGCSVEWEGGSRITEDGAVMIELNNADPSCAVAGCGNCIYDVRGDVSLDEAMRRGEIPFTLSRLPCNGSNGLNSEWTLPLGEQPSGTRCMLSDSEGAAGAQSKGAGRSDELFTPCTTDAALDPVPFPVPILDCGEGLSCVNERCLPACTADSDCPLQGALPCQEGFCQLPE
jgi:hypothetical protein